MVGGRERSEHSYKPSFAPPAKEQSEKETQKKFYFPIYLWYNKNIDKGKETDREERREDDA